MNVRAITTILLLHLLPLSILAQPTGGVTGTVISRADREPIDGASITLYQGTAEVASAVTGETGVFRIESLADGMYDLLVQAPGFLETRVNFAVVDGYVKNMFNITLSQARPEIIEEMVEDFDMDDSGYSDNPTVLFDQNDVFNSIAGYNFSSVRFNLRGYSSETQDVYLAGVKLNDAVTGYAPFSLWSGLNEATRSKTTVNGAEVSDYGLGGYNGLTNIYADAPNVRTGLRGSVLTNSSLYRLRLMMTYSSGVMDNGWSYALSVSARLGGNDWIDGVYYRSFGYYASVAKDWGSHRLALTLLGTPGSRGAQNASTQEVYDLMGDNMYNSNWGYQAGLMRNARVRNTHEPIAFLHYEYKPSDRFRAMATALFRFGSNGYTALDWNDAQDPRPDYYRNLPSYFWVENADYGRNSLYKWAAAREAWMHSSRYPNITHLNWDRLYDVNRNNVEGTEGKHRSKYIQEERFTDQRDFNFAGNFKWRAKNWVTLTGGLSARINRTEYYKKVADLLGGDYYVDVDSFAEREYGSVEAKTQNDLDYYLIHGKARTLKTGDKFG
ncbi:MAG: carboxypeptidase-like regulatory domain-containing protein, partial [Bacteroidales bacterium]|nr:carboxypeptidase-like regulatory domain-containing protein [Bacteroidales bacterium]